jgi:hypothetical protein
MRDFEERIGSLLTLLYGGDIRSTVRYQVQDPQPQPANQRFIADLVL